MLVFLLLALASTPAARAARAGGAGPRPDFRVPPDPFDFRAHEVCWPTGLRVVVERDTRQPVVAVSMQVEGGSAADPPGKEGTAHLLEHLWFRVRTPGGRRVWDAVQDLGAVVNASTFPDAVSYVTLAPREALPAVLALEAQRLSDPLAGIGEADVAHERAIVLAEVRQRFEDTSLLAWRFLPTLLFPDGHPYRRVGASDAASLGAIALADLRHARDVAYRPERATLHVVGDVDPATFPALLDEAFPDELIGVPEGTPRRSCGPRLPSREDPPPPASRGLKEIPAAVARPLLAVGWSLPGAWREDEALSRVLLAQLEAAIAERLDWYTWQAPTPREEPSCQLVPGLHASVALCRVEVPEGRTGAETLARLSGGVDDLWLADPAVRSLVWKWSSHALMARVLQGSETLIDPFGPDGRDARLRDHFTADPLVASALAQDLRAFGVEEAATFAAKWLAPERAAAVLLVPGDAAAVAGEGYAGAPDDERAEGAALPTPAAAGLDLSAMEDFVLPNGLRVVLLPWGEVPVVRVALHTRGGSALEPSPALATLARGVTVLDYQNIGFSPRRELFALGASLLHGEGATDGAYVASAASAHLDPLLYLLRLRVDALSADMDRREGWLDLVDAWMHRLPAEDRRDAAIRAALWPGHPLGRNVDPGILAGARRYGADAVEDWIAATHRPEEATLVVVGRIEAATARTQVEARFASWRGRARAALPPLGPPPAPPARVALGWDVAGRTQTEVGVDCQVGPVDPRAPEALEVLDALSRGTAWWALRERAAATYTPQAWTTAWEGGSAGLGLRARVAHAAAPDAARALLDLVAALGTVGDREVERARRKLALAAPLGQITAPQVLGRLVDVAAAGGEWALLSRRAERLEAVAASQVRGLLAPCVGHEVVSLVGPRETLPGEVGGVSVAWESANP